MIQLFVSDIDGCIAEPYQPYDFVGLTDLVALIHRREPTVPAFSLCSGRAFPYVEALSQMLGLTFPVLFESGGGMFDPQRGRVRWNPLFSESVEDHLLEIRRWLLDEFSGTSMMYDFGKRTQAGIIGPDFGEVAAAVPVVETFVAERFPGFRVFHTNVSIDVVHTDITKKQALEWLSAETGIALGDMAYIGDTNGDIPALEVVGHSFSPANGTDAVRSVVDHPLDRPVLEGVLAAFEHCLARNRKTGDLPRTGS